MRKYGSLLIRLASAHLALLLLGCNAQQGNDDAVRQPGEDALELLVVDGENRILILIVNDSEHQIIVNNVMRVAGASHELEFSLDGVQLELDSVGTRGLPEVLEGQDNAITLRDGSLHGAVVKKADLRSLYGISEGACHSVVVTYKERVNSGSGRFEGELVSNGKRICF